MKVVILSAKRIPGFGVYGPIMTPTEYDVHLILKWIAARIDVREVMEDGSYRKLTCNDKRLMEELDKKHAKIQKDREDFKKARKEVEIEKRQRGNIIMKPEKKPHPQPKIKVLEEKPLPVVKEEPKQIEDKKEEPKVDIMIDDLEPME